ncbi:poly-beta-1,6-N-acetyl-D-glucosamine N-deacetylase PgaB [Hydrogenimonas sp.]
MRRVWSILLLVLLFASGSMADTAERNRFWVLCYHNVVDRIEDPDLPSITTAQLVSHFEWLKRNGYHVIGIDDILAAREGKKSLPKKAVLLTFDDGYTSFYTRIFPLLKLYGYRAVFALVGKWQQTPKGESFSYGEKRRARSMLLEWDQIRQMVDSGLVEIASHSYDAHRGVFANPQGNTRPFYSTLLYKNGAYESEEAYRKRVEDDIRRSSDLLLEKLGKRPRVIVWPYGAYNGTVVRIAKKYGMQISASLDDGVNSLEDTDVIKRFLVGNDAGLSDMLWGLRPEEKEAERALFVDIDEIYDPDGNRTEARLGVLLERIKAIAPSDVYLKGYSDPDGDGRAEALYFPNRAMPLRADLLSRVLWQIKSRTGYTRVHVVLPLEGYEIGEKKGLRPDREEDRETLASIFADMARHTFVHGIAVELSPSSRYGADEVAAIAAELRQSVEPYTMRHRLSLIVGESGVGQSQKDRRVLLGRFDRLIYDLRPLPGTEEGWREFFGTVEGFGEKLLVRVEGDEVRVAEAMERMTLRGVMRFGYFRSDWLGWRPSDRFMRAFSTNYDPFGE